MKLEDQVCSFESARRLKYLGVNQKSLFYYQDHKRIGFKEQLSPSLLYGLPTHPMDCEIFAAFTVAELGGMLPTLGIEWVKSNDGKGRDFWWGKTNYPSLKNQIRVDDYSEAEARAKMLIYLIENKLLDKHLTIC